MTETRGSERPCLLRWVIAYHPHDMRVGKANNYAKVRNLEAFLDNLREGELATGSTNTFVYSRE